MQPIKTDQTTHKFVADGCADLPAAVYQSPEGRVIETCWQMSKEEAAEVARTGKVYVHQIGFVVPMNVEVFPYALNGGLRDDKANNNLPM